MLLTIIVACEIGFWVLLVSGLSARYLLRRPGLGALLLLSVPIVDLVLLTATIVHLRDAATTADFTHGLAAAYLGFTVAFGHATIQAADVRFAHFFAGGPAPRKRPRGGPERAAHEWRAWLRTLLAWAVACALLAGAIALVGDADRTAALLDWIEGLTVLLGVALLSPLYFQARSGRGVGRTIAH